MIPSIQPAISVVICTRNRGDSIAATLDTIVTNTHSNFEVIVVDQSTNQDTFNAIRRFQSVECFQYIQSDTQGVSRARNIGLARARGDIVVFTDDDCTVPENWLESIEPI